MSGNVLFGDWHGTPRGDDEDARYTVTPVGDECLYCGIPIAKGDVGEMMPYHRSESLVDLVPVHRKCLMQAILPESVIAEIEARMGRSL